MITVADVQQALESVMDPELGQNIVELGMVREIEVEGTRVGVTIALTVPNCPLQDTIARDAAEAVDALGDELDVQIRLTAMTDEERAQLREKLRRERAPQAQPEESLAGKMNQVQAVVAVMSGKGGVGKSTTAALLAAGLRRQGLRVGVLDADITGPSIPKLFGVHGKPAMSPLGIIPAQTETGIKAMSINLLLDREDEAVIWRGPLIANVITQFWNEVFWGDLDVLVVDLPPGTSDASLTVLQTLPVTGVLMVTSPQELAEMVVRKAARMAEQLQIPILGVVENMSYARCPHCGEPFSLFGKGHAEQMAESFDTEVLGHLPLDPELARAGDAGRIEHYTDESFEPVVKAISEKL